MVGHSWGGDTAAQVAAGLGSSGRRVTNLITIDPVGNFMRSDFYGRVRSGAQNWVNVNVNAGGEWWDFSNIVAAVGGPYGRAPAGFAHGFLESPEVHAEFGHMMSTSMFDGVTLENRIIGNGVLK